MRKWFLSLLLLVPLFLQHPLFTYSSLFTSKVVGPAGVNLSNSYRLLPTAVFYFYRKGRSGSLERLPDFLKARDIEPSQLEFKPRQRCVR